MDRPVALVVDRDPAVRALLAGVLEERGFLPLGAETAADAREVLAARSIATLVVDLELAAGAAVGLIDHARELRPEPLIVGLGDPAATGTGDETVRSSLFDAIPKPIGRDRIERLARRSVCQLELLEQLRRLQADLRKREGYDGIVGRSEAMGRLREEIERLAWTGEPVWITGENGAGKELAARTLHATSPQGDRDFVLVGCAEVREAGELVAEGGALDRARGGTLFLEELPELRIDLQEDLDRAVTDHLARRASGDATIRFVTGSREQAKRVASDGRLVPGLREKLSKVELHVPPLRERREDVALLANHFLAAICEINHLPPVRISAEALSLLERHDWPENVHELRNAIEQAVILNSDGIIRAADLPDSLRESGETATAPSARGLSRRTFREAKREVVEAFEQAYLAELLERHGGNVTAASQQAGMLRSALQRLLRKHALKSAEFRKGRRPASRRLPSESVDEVR
jgi:two-component system nitrogen regulation response regulator NtrX